MEAQAMTDNIEQIRSEVEQIGRDAKAVALRIGMANTEQKNDAQWILLVVFR